jgi:hypothetical protein
MRVIEESVDMIDVGKEKNFWICSLTRENWGKVSGGKNDEWGLFDTVSDTK